MKRDPGERAATLDLDFSYCAATVDDTFKTNDNVSMISNNCR